MNIKRQIVVIHGGEVFNSYEDYLKYLKNYPVDLNRLIKRPRWKNYLQDDLGDSWEVFSPQMPNFRNAKYLEWKIWFEKILPHLQDGVVLIGQSLGGIFLAKYLSENDFSVKISATYLVAAPFDSKARDDIDYTLGDFELPESLEKFQAQSEKIFIYHSKDDSLVPFSDLEKYSRALPKAEKVIFYDRGHFIQEHFPEIVEEIRKLEK